MTGPTAGRTALLNASDPTLDSIDGKGMSGAYREETDRSMCDEPHQMSPN